MYGKSSVGIAAIAAISLMTGLLESPAALATNGYFSDGYGVKSEATGGASIALPQDTLTIATNPAGLAQIGDEFDIGVDLFQPQRGATITQEGGSESFNGDDRPNFLIPSIGLSRQLGGGVVAGIAIYGNGGLNTSYASNPFAGFGARGEAGVNLSQAFISPAVAWKFTDQQSVGIALNVVYQTFEARGIGIFSVYSEDPTAVSNRGSESSTGLGFRLGWLGNFGPVSLGLSWQPQIHTSRLSNYAGLFADQGEFAVPASYGAGLAWHAGKQLDLAVDWQRIEYANVAAVGDPINALFSDVPLGATGGPGFGWSNISVVKVGALYRATDALTLRAGFADGQQPVQPSQTFFNLLAPGVVKTHYTLGGSLKINHNNEVTLSYLYAPRQTVYGSGSIPPGFGGGEVNVHLAEESLGIGYNHSF
jgi:long-chain fatty acid transport protein